MFSGNRKLKKLLAQWEKGELSAKDFSKKLSDNNWTWDDLRGLTAEEGASDGDGQSAIAVSENLTSLRGRRSKLSLAALVLAVLAFLSLLGFGLWTSRQLSEQREKLEQLTEQKDEVNNAVRLSTRSLDKIAKRVSALETATAPEPVVVNNIEAESIPQSVYVDSDPMALRFRVHGQNVEGQTVEFDVNPEDLAGLVTPHTGMVLEGVATVILQPDEVGIVTITPQFGDQRFRTYSISIAPRPSPSLQIEPQQTVAGHPTIFSITVINNGVTQILDSTLLCQKPDAADIVTPIDFQPDGDEISTQIDSMSMGERVTRRIELVSDEAFTLSCRVEDDLGNVLGEDNVQVEVAISAPQNVVINPPVLDVGINANVTITATVTDLSGLPLSDIPVSWAISDDVLGKFITESVSTDIAGHAQVILNTLAVGEGVLTASVASGSPISTSIPITITDTRPTPIPSPTAKTNWSLISSDGSGKSRIFKSKTNDSIIGGLPAGRPINGALQNDWLSTEVTLWMKKEFVGGNSRLTIPQDGVKICWDIPISDDSSCGNLTAQANGMSVTVNKEPGERDGWISITFAVWIRQEDLK